MKLLMIKLLVTGCLITFGFFVHAQKIGFLLGKFVSDRWYLDQKFLTDRINELGGECLVEIAYEPAEQVILARKLIQHGVKVLVVVPLDATKAAEIAAISKAAGVPVISYDRLILSNDIEIYVSYNNEEVGRLQAEYSLKKIPEGNYFLINGPTSDNNAILFRKGQLEVLKPHVARGKIKILDDYVLNSWSEIEAFEKMTEYFSTKKVKPDVIIAANDALANGVIQSLPPDLAGKVIITGQDADLTSIRNIIAGTQTLTIYKPIKPLAYMVAEMAIALAKGKHVKGQFKMQTGSVTVESILLDPIVVDINNYKETVIKDGHASLSEVVRNLGEAFEQERSKIQLSLLQKEKDLEIEKKVSQRNTFIAIVAFFVLSIVGLTYTIYTKQKDNKLLNNQRTVIEGKNQELNQSNERLQTLNEELTQQQEEISSQRDAIAHQKEKLQEAYNIIATQKDEILHQNEKLEVEVQKRTADLVDKIRQLEQYAFITAHNLRAPVARIIGLGQLIKMEQSDPKEITFIIDKLVGASEELDTVIKELNAILDIRTFSMEVLTEVDLKKVLNDIKDNLKSEIEQTNAIIEFDFSAVRSIFSIKPYIHSIFFNLVSNALKYRDPDRQPMILIKSEKTGNQVCLTVSDNGMGIDLKLYKDMVFKLYKRFHFHVEGRGIGLFLVKTQIDSLGGSIQLESEVNTGTTFKIFLNDHTAKIQDKTNVKHIDMHE